MNTKRMIPKVLAVLPVLALGCTDGATLLESDPANMAAFESSEQMCRDSDDDHPARSRTVVADFLGRYATGLLGLGSSGETAALRKDRLFVTSAQAGTVDIVDVSNPSAPLLLRRVSLKAHGPTVQSVDVSSRGLVAVAVAAVKKTDPGKVIFLNRDGDEVGAVVVGALPDMVAFTHDGQRLVVANEGEPDCYGAGCTDPEGSVSLIDTRAPKRGFAATTISFAGIPLPEGVRVYGPGATAAQDLEPEYITISEDDKTAYVTLQENNAIAVINLRTARVKEIRALGYKDFSVAPTTATYEFGRLPRIGSTAAGQSMRLGGFSGLFFEGRTPDGKLHFIANTDRGPNAEPIDGKRPFLLPNFTPRLVRFELDAKRNSVAITQQILLRGPTGIPLTGLPNTIVAGGSANSAHNDEIPVDLFGTSLPLDRLGGDFEGIVVAEDGSFWLCDEYRPALYHFDAAGVLLQRLVPKGSHLAAGLVVPAVGLAGELGIETLPEVLGQRRQNRGFEAIAMQGGKLYAFVQSPLRNPASLANGVLNAMVNIRLVEVNLATLATRQFLYTLDNPVATGTEDTRADKIGDATAIPGGGFLVVERDDDALPLDPATTITKKIYTFGLAGATDITTKDMLYVGKSLDQMTVAELSVAGVKPIAKVLHMDLAKAGYANVQKVEGLAYLDATTIAVVNDNDFGVAAINVHNATGTFTRADGYIPEPVLLGIVSTSGLDASDKDNVANIRPWPVRGMYQPDAIAQFKVHGQTYLVTANEGDARDYTGFAEETRARAVAASYPAWPELSRDAEMGRLNITKAPPAGDMSIPYVFGTRSISVWNATTGAQTWDSGADIERRAFEAFPAFFNSNNDANDFDSRSDNKGPEPEGVAVGNVGGRIFAFVGLERMGGVMIYDVTQPTSPTFVNYLHTRDFAASPVGPDSGPEVIRFVDAGDSPIRAPMLVVSNEISGTVAMWRLSTR